jgi:hypothetical protein
MTLDDLLRAAQNGATIIIQNLHVGNVYNNTADTIINGDGNTINANRVALPAQQRTPLIAGGVDYRSSHCVPSDYDANDPHNVWQQMHNLRHGVDSSPAEPFEPDYLRRRERGDIYEG